MTSGAVNAGLITDAKEYITELAVEETNAKVFSPGTLLVAMYGEGQTRGRSVSYESRPPQTKLLQRCCSMK